MQNIGRLPLGVAILAILIGLFGLFVLLLGLAFLFVAAGASLGGIGVASVFGFTGTVAAIVISVIGLVILATAVGLWNQEMWALALAALVLIVYAIVEFVSGGWLGLLLVVLLLVYLGAVSRHFD